MNTGDVRIRMAGSDASVRAAHALLVRRIDRGYVEDLASFRVSACLETAHWVPRLGLAVRGAVAVDRHEGGDEGSWLAAAQLGGLLPDVAMLSLPYTAVVEEWEGQGIYLRLKQAMLAELLALARARGLPEPRGNLSEEARGSAQYARKVGRGIAVELPVAYVQPAAHGLSERSLALTYEPLAGPIPAFTPVELLRLVTAVYRGLYRIDQPEAHPAFRRIAAALDQ